MKRYIALFLTLMMLFQTGCGGENAAPHTQAPQPESSEQAEPLPPEPETEPMRAPIQDITAFLHGMEPAESETMEDGMLFRNFHLDPGAQGLTEQYMQLLIDHYDMKLVTTVEKDHDTAFTTFYYLNYAGPADIQTLSLDRADCNFFVGSVVYKDDASVQLGLYMPHDADYVDDGHRADLSAIAAPEPEPEPAGPEVIPDFLENDISGVFRAGNSAFDHAVCFLANDTTYYSAAEAYVQLLIDMGYTLSDTEEKSMRTWSRMQWDLYYEGKDWDTIDDNAHVRVKHLASDRDGERKTEISITYSEDITYGGDEQFKGGGGGGGSSGGSWNPNLPDHSKLQCLTCDGSGDCPSCGGHGEKTRAGITKDCTRCDRGDCPTCHGSGTR